MDGGEESILLGDFEIDDDEENRKLVEGESSQILRVFFGGEEGFDAGGTGGGLKFVGIALIVTVVVGKFAGKGEGKIPVFQVLKKGARVADAAEGIEGTGADFGGRQGLNASAEAAKAKQAGGSGKDRKVLKYGDGRLGLRGGFGAREDENIGALHGREGLAQRSGREKELAVEGLRGVEKEDVDVAGKRKVLEAVVEKEEVHGGFELLALGVAIRAHTEESAILEAEFHEFDFVAGAGGTFVAAGENGEALSFGEKFFGEPDDHGSLAGTANGEIADADDRASEALRLKVTLFVEPDAEAGEIAIEHRKRPEEQAQPRRKIHFARPPRCLEISATARSRAPRLVSTSCFAASPMRCIFSESLSRWIISTPASSGLST